MSCPATACRLFERGEAYFLHGYHFDAADATDVLATTNHGGAWVAAVGRDNIIGVQFHLKKSQAYGINFLNAFWSGSRDCFSRD
jgi:imidazole glycerol-phosphate synthase subunit HisH